MAKNHVLDNALKQITNAAKAGERQVCLHPAPKVLVRFVELMQKNGYIRGFEEVENTQGGELVVQLNGRLDKCSVDKPVINVRLAELEEVADKLVARLPTHRVVRVVLTTSAGIITEVDAHEKHVSGKIIGYFY
ncbi:putative 40S ribosomal protein S22 [Rhypophila sp. PSN 637]